MVLLGCYYDFLVVVFNHMTLMPRRNLGPHVRYSHLIEPLGARWSLGMRDVTHCNPFLCNLISVLSLVLPQRYSANRVLVSREQLQGANHVHH